MKNPVVLTGNVRANWANEILRNFDAPDSSPIGVEFVGIAITSGGDGSDTGRKHTLLSGPPR